MHGECETLLEHWQVRKSKKQKLAFEEHLLATLRAAGYADARAEECGSLIKSRNLIAGDPDTAAVIFTAHYDTCAVLPVPNFIMPQNFLLYLLYQAALVGAMLIIATLIAALSWLLPFSEDVLYLISTFLYAVALIALCAMLVMGPPNKHTANDNTSGVITLLEAALALPPERRGGIAFVWFDNEETGLWGSMGFAAKHKAVAKSTPLLNFDCVSDGDSFLLVIPAKSENDSFTDLLRACFTPAAGAVKELVIGVTGKTFYPSDQVHFKRGVGVAALQRGKRGGLYMDRIHTKHDTVFDRANIHYLSDCVVALAERMG